MELERPILEKCGVRTTFNVGYRIIVYPKFRLRSVASRSDFHRIPTEAPRHHPKVLFRPPTNAVLNATPGFRYSLHRPSEALRSPFVSSSLLSLVHQLSLMHRSCLRSTALIAALLASPVLVLAAAPPASTSKKGQTPVEEISVHARAAEIMNEAQAKAEAKAQAQGKITPQSQNLSESQNDSQNATKESTPVKPLLKWTFDATEPGVWIGKAAIQDLGPKPPVFPAFKKENKAAFFNGDNSMISVREADLPGMNLRFTNGDSVTFEAWVNLEELKDGQYIYIIGKGRNKNTAFDNENQNWALRLKAESGEAKPCFLFRSTQKTNNWHRWVAKDGFGPGSGWHHIAVTYQFGKPDQIRAYVDGKKSSGGTWDMGGKTTQPPVTDGDDVLIGTGNGGGKSNTLNGFLDEVAIYREALPEALLAQRYQFVPPPPPVNQKMLTEGKVLVQICENGVQEKNAWPTLPAAVTETYQEDVFGFFELPQKYVDTGVRGDRANPCVMRAAAMVELPPGKHRLLLRGRGASHLHVDGKQLLATAFPRPDSGGHGRLAEQKDWLNLGPDFRFAPPGNNEAWCEFESKGGKHLFVMEQVVGGMLGKNKRRPEIGETVVAISLQGTESWNLLSPGKRQVAYTDAGWEAYETERREWLKGVNAERRATVRAEHESYWKKRREEATKWLTSSKEVPVPAPSAGLPASNAIDHFLNEKIAKVKAEKNASKNLTVDFFRDIQPILETKCYDCHKGAKTKGDLKLDSLADAQHGGAEEGPAVSPGHPDKSSLLARVVSTEEDAIMPPKGDPLTKEQVALLTTWIKEGAHWPEMKTDRLEVTPLADDLAFLRRVSLDVVGVAPSLEEIETFTKDQSPDKRAKAIDRFLADGRWADRWVSYWQDVLAENPNILNPTLNNTGPFRWWIYESLEDDKPMDLFVTELLRMRGSERFGGPAGFGTASQNDVPMAAKGTIVSSAFLGVEMKCARCHDAPAHTSSQQDLFELAAMLKTETIEVPPTSSVPMDKLHEGGRKPLIQVTLQPGAKVAPKWPFDEFCDPSVAAKLAEDPKDERDVLASLISAPSNERFAQVIANRIWKQFMGRGIVEPLDDWEKGKATHPDLVKWLGRELVRGGYSMKNLARVILNSNAYQRATDTELREASPLYSAPAPRRLDAEQIVDSMFAATGKRFHTEEVSLDIDGRREFRNSLSLGKPTRSWMLTSTSNERDRPSLSLPRIQAVCDVLAAFGWRGARQDPSSVRESAPNALQPAILSNGTVGIWLTRLSDDHGITQLALQDQSVDQLLDTLYLKMLTRKPTEEERKMYREYLAEGYDSRIAAKAEKSETEADASSATRRPVKFVTWTNHLDPEATIVRQQEEVAARKGDPPTTRLSEDWRLRMEDVLWAMLNAPEWVFAP